MLLILHMHNNINSHVSDQSKIKSECARLSWRGGCSEQQQEEEEDDIDGV